MNETRTVKFRQLLNKGAELEGTGRFEDSVRTHGSKRAAPLQEAEDGILADLVNALLAEGLLDAEKRGQVLTATELRVRYVEVWPYFSRLYVDESVSEAVVGPKLPRPSDIPIDFYIWQADRETGHCIVFPIVPAVIQAYRYVRGGGIFELKAADSHTAPVSLDPPGLLQRVTDVLYSRGQGDGNNDDNGVSRLLALLRLSMDQTVWSMSYPAGRERFHESGPLPPNAADSDSTWNLIMLERLASFRDRPFHPVAKAKGGWKQADYDTYSAEAGRPIALEWVAVKRSCLLSGSGNGISNGIGNGSGNGYGPAPADLLLSPGNRRLLEEEMNRSGLLPEEYMALPVHPWQKAAVLPLILRKELDAGIWVPLETKAGIYYATSSARSLAPADRGSAHVKLPLGIVSLGAVRYLPAVHMMNSEKGQRLLEQAKQTDAVLQERLSLCDERSWWAYIPDDGDLFADPPRHLSAMVRRYPAGPTGGARLQLVPMSSLAVQHTLGTEHVMDDWMRQRGLQQSAASAAMLYGEICFEFFHICLRLFRLGVMPEIHGQNTLLTLNDGYLSGMLLRDHDSVRLHLPWLKEHGLDDPNYKMKPGYPNSLYNETPEKLLFYLQTLGIQVNLYSILETVAERYQVREGELWEILQKSLHKAIKAAELPPAVKGIVQAALFENPVWPWKNILRPLLEQEGSPSGSMPSGAGEAVNPFHQHF